MREPGGPNIDAVVEEDGRFLVVWSEMHFFEIASADEIEFGDVQFVGHVVLLLFRKGRVPYRSRSQKYAVRFSAAVIAVTQEAPAGVTGGTHSSRKCWPATLAGAQPT